MNQLPSLYWGLRLSSGRIFLTLCVVFLFGWGAPVLAQSPVSLQSTAEIERSVKQADGSTVMQRVLAQAVPPGEVVIFTNTLRNTSAKKADSLLLTNPVPENMRLQKAWGDAARIVYSVDGGKHYDQLEGLVVTNADGKQRPARVEDVTHIRWTLRDSLAAGQSTSVGFHAVVR